MEPSDAALISACRRGDESAWDILVERYQRLIFTIARRAGLSEEDAAEVLQRVFMALLEQLDTIQQPDRLALWLTSTTQRQAWRLRRREEYLPMLSRDDATMQDVPSDPALLPDAVVERLEEQERVHQALKALDERCRRLLSLLFLRPEPPSYAEVATRLEMREGAIGPTRARCLEKLRRLLF
jgi:RNA polymerase sigma factor (sigma-70 family)